jgi:putative IMPACT (imprinted ancient) family translation regulator
MTSIYKEKGSRFYGLSAEVNTAEEFAAFLKEVKREYKGARHYCWAYIIEGSERRTNDGEPSGCGEVLLSLLKTRNLKNHAVVVVRYFGGVQLGVGNLIKAYRTAGEGCLA